MPGRITSLAGLIHRSRFHIVLVSSLTLLTALACYGIYRERAATLEAARRDVLSIADAMQVHVTSELVRSLYSIKGVQSDLAKAHTNDIEKLQTIFAGAMRYDPVSAFMGRLSGSDMLLIDRQGHVVRGGALRLSLEDVLLTKHSGPVAILPLIRDPEADVWYMPLVLKVDDATHSREVLFSLIPAIRLVDSAANLKLLSEGRFGVFSADGQRLFRYLGQERLFEIRPSPVPSDILRTIMSSSSGNYDTASSVDQRRVIFGFSHSRELPLFVVVGTPRGPLELAWAKRSLTQLILVVIGCFAWIIFGLQLRRVVFKLASSRRLYRELFKSIEDGLVIVQRDGIIRKCNPAAVRLVRAKSESQLIGLNLFALGAREAGDSAAGTRGLVQLLALSPGATSTSDWTLRRLDGSGDVDVKMQLSAFADDTDLFATALLRDVTIEREYLSRQEYLARHDTLTGLLNRYGFLNRVARRIDEQRRKPFVVALMDLNRFKEINDSLGHQAGDKVLETLGGRLVRMHAERTGCVARLGGDEIAIYADPAEWPGGVAQICRELHAAIEEPFVVNGASFEVTASLGVAMYPDDATEPEQILRCADIAMYSAKRAMLPVKHYARSLDGYTARSLALKSDFVRAIREGGLSLVYQAKIRLADGTLAGFEALSRWTHPTEGPISPAVFVPLAETTELIYPFTHRVIGEAVAQLRAWQEQGYRPTVSVNVSANNVLHPDFAGQVRALLDEFGVSPEFIELEVTESTLMRDPDMALRQLGQLRDIGVKLAIDDFGTGYSSLAYLKRLPVQTLKIDRSFISSLTSEYADRCIVETSIHLAHSFGMEVVAEGVETSDVVHALKQMGCDIVQGFFYDRPASGWHTAERWLTTDVREANLRSEKLVRQHEDGVTLKE